MTVVFLNIFKCPQNMTDLIANVMLIVLNRIILSKTQAVVWDLAERTVGIAAMEVLQASPKGQFEANLGFYFGLLRVSNVP